MCLPAVVAGTQSRASRQALSSCPENKSDLRVPFALARAGLANETRTQVLLVFGANHKHRQLACHIQQNVKHLGGDPSKAPSRKTVSVMSLNDRIVEQTDCPWLRTQRVLFLYKGCSNPAHRVLVQTGRRTLIHGPVPVAVLLLTSHCCKKTPGLGSRSLLEVGLCSERHVFGSSMRLHEDSFQSWKKFHVCSFKCRLLRLP